MAMVMRDRPLPGWFENVLSWPPRLLHVDDFRVEQFVEGDKLVVRSELPGIDPDRDVDIEVRGHALHISAQRRHEEQTKERGYYRSEFRYGSFTRTVPLPAGATERDVKASYRDGILEVRVPIDTTTEQTRHVPVERAEPRGRQGATTSPDPE